MNSLKVSVLVATCWFVYVVSSPLLFPQSCNDRKNREEYFVSS